MNGQPSKSKDAGAAAAVWKNVQVYVYADAYMCLHVPTYACKHMHAHIRMYVCMYVCMFVCMYVCL